MLGEDLFRELLRQLIRDFKEKNFGEEDFYACAQKVIGDDSKMQIKFELWYKDHIHVKGYTVLKVVQFDVDAVNKQLTVEVSVQHGKYFDVQFKAYDFDSQLIRQFDFNPNAGQNGDVERHTLVIHEIDRPVAFIVPNCTFGSFISTQLDLVSLRNLFDKFQPRIHRLPLLERAVVYQSFVKHQVSELKPKVYAGAILDDSFFLQEIFGHKWKQWGELPYRLALVEHKKML